jgi:glutathione peroxidase
MTIYDISVVNAAGRLVQLSEYEGKVLLVVNTATHCQFTPQYEGLQHLYEKYNAQGFEVLDFPSNQFGNQAPETIAEINIFCEKNYHTTFPRFDKVDVNGMNESPLYTFLKAQKDGAFASEIKWNFTKFLIGSNGNVVGRFSSAIKPETIDGAIASQLALAKSIVSAHNLTR